MDSNESFLQELYKNTKMGAESIVDLMDKASDPRMRAEMTAELARYESYAKQVAALMAERGLKPEEPGMMAKAGAKIGMTFNTMLDTTTSHIAEMMINGATMGIINIEKQLHSADARPETKKLAEDILSFEKSSSEKLTRFLS